MSKFWRALVVSAVATGAAAAAWQFVAHWRERSVQLGETRANADLRSRDEEIESLTQQQKDLMLREMSEHV